jgi:hypothetical protein
MKEKNIGIYTALGENADFVQRVDEACEKAASNIIQRVQEIGATPVPQAQGFFAEVWHSETFNADTVLKRMKGVWAEIPKSNALKSPDIIIKEDGKVMQELSAKYYGSSGKPLDRAGQSVNAQKGYGDQGRLIPADQHEDAKEFLKRKIAKDSINRPENSRDLQEVRDNLTDRAKHGKAESQTLGRKESEAKFKETKKENQIEIRPQIDASKIVEESLRSGAIAAGITISVAVAPRIYNTLVHRNRSGEWPPDVMQSIFQGTGKKTAESGLRGAVATSLTMSARAGFLGETLRTVDPTAIGTLTFIAFEGAKDFVKYKNGEMSGELLANGMMQKSVAATAGAYGATIGQVVIPVPIVGAMIGAMVGSIVAQNGYQFLDVVTEAYFRTRELEEMIQVNYLLANEWSVFVSSYDRWIENAAQFERERWIWDGRFNNNQIKNEFLNSQLREALEIDND